MNLRRLIEKIENFELTLRIPVFGLGCGVLGLTLAKSHVKMGKWASRLLKSLEYRGYDSTGAAFQDDKKNVVLLKDVGAPSVLVETLGINKQEAKLFCGQVRWATFGAVDRVNAQPHNVSCKRHIYGAHNGNITNTRELKQFLQREGHAVLSDNDGEMLVHTVEHYFDIELDKLSATDQKKPQTRKAAMRRAILEATRQTIGSFAAVVCDPVTETQWAIKAGSSLYFGVGTIEDTPFALASSDLTAVLRFTKELVKLQQGEFIEYTANEFQIYAYNDIRIRRLNRPDEVFKRGDRIDRKAVRSKLRAEDTELQPQFKYFMQQEIFAEIESTGKLVKMFLGGSNTGRHTRNFLNEVSQLKEIQQLLKKVMKQPSFQKQVKVFDEYVDSDRSELFIDNFQKHYRRLYDEVFKEDFDKKYFFSNDKNTFIDIAGEPFDKKRMLLAKALDSVSEKQDIEEFDKIVADFIKLIRNTLRNSRNIYTVACGTSFHATKLAAAFFNEIAGVEIIPILPGDYRGQYSNCMKENDVIIGVSQSGETKDLIDIFNDIDNLGIDIKKIVLVNNMNSTLGQEKSDISIPIFCGPEIAVPATKSFINQMTLFYYLAIKVAEMRFEECKGNGGEEQLAKMDYEISRRYKTLLVIPELIKETIYSSEESIEFVASKIYMEPSMHILATKLSGVAKEGALKIRETVLNHCEGGEASEFKHGPNTILGKNTVFGMKNIKAMVKYFQKKINEMEREGVKMGLKNEEIREMIKAFSTYMFTRTMPFNLSGEGLALFKRIARDYDIFTPLYRNYPLIYVTGPDERDVNLTISQINTHKIRGADTFVIAEENDRLMENASSSPDQKKYYGFGYIILPRTGDSLLTAFSASIVLQLLALKMSVRKMAYLDRVEFVDHGVHPDVPKNVSKSITVD